MRPLHAVAAGLVLITIDFRTTSIDLLPDIVGWLLLAWAAWAWRDRAMLGATAAGGVCSLPLLALPYHHVQFDQITGEKVVVAPGTDLGYAEFLEYDALTGVRLLAYGGTAAAVAIVVLLTVRTLVRRSREWDGPSVRRSTRRLCFLAGAAVLLWTVPRLVAVGAKVGDGLDPIWDDPASKIALVGSLATVALAVALLNDAREPWAGSVPQAPSTTGTDDETVVGQ